MLFHSKAFCRSTSPDLSTASVNRNITSESQNDAKTRYIISLLSPTEQDFFLYKSFVCLTRATVANSIHSRPWSAYTSSPWEKDFLSFILSFPALHFFLLVSLCRYLKIQPPRQPQNKIFLDYYL